MAPPPSGAAAGAGSPCAAASCARAPACASPCARRLCPCGPARAPRSRPLTSGRWLGPTTVSAFGRRHRLYSRASLRRPWPSARLPLRRAPVSLVLGLPDLGVVAREEAACTVPCNVGSGNISRVPCQSSDDQDDVEYPFEDADLDDGLDPIMQEELDREVEDFARRLNSVWPERRHLGQERRIESHMIGGNGSLQRFSGTIAAKVPLMKIVVLSIVLLLVYNCSGLFIAIRAKMLSKSRKKAAKIVQESATGRITAIMGPSGAGKTTFLNAVLGKTSGYKKDGLVLINGKSGSMQSYKKIICFVPQDDIIHGNLTVEENLWFSACCSIARLS